MRLWSLKSASLILLLLLLAACSKKKNTYSVFGAPVEDGPTCSIGFTQTQQRYLDEFPVLDAYGYPGVAKDSSFGESPFGVLIAFLESGDRSYCTITHVSPGNVLTAAHCVEDSRNTADYGIIYFDTAGQRRYGRIYSFAEGNSKDYDGAVLRACSATANTWPTAGIDIHDIGGINQNPPQGTQVKIWSYDPIKNYSAISARYNGRAGMLFRPKSCVASRTVPVIHGYSGGRNVGAITNPQANPEIHVFMENCNELPVSGNSGSIVSLASDFNAKIAVYHWGVSPSKWSNYSQFCWITSAVFGGKCSPSFEGIEFYEVGTALDALGSRLSE